MRGLKLIDLVFILLAPALLLYLASIAIQVFISFVIWDKWFYFNISEWHQLPRFLFGSIWITLTSMVIEYRVKMPQLKGDSNEDNL